MTHLILCEGQDDSVFLASLLQDRFQGGIFPNLRILSFGSNDFSVVADETLVIAACSGLDSMNNFLTRLAERSTANPYRQIPTLFVWDEDPGNSQSEERKKAILDQAGRMGQKVSEPVVISPMLEGLIIQYLSGKLNRQESTGYPKEGLLNNALKCMVKYLSPLRKALSMAGEGICPDSKEGKPNYTWLYSKVFLTKLFGAKIKPGAELAFRRGLILRMLASKRVISCQGPLTAIGERGFVTRFGIHRGQKELGWARQDYSRNFCPH